MGAIWLLGVIGALTEETSIEFLVKAVSQQKHITYSQMINPY